MSTQIRAWRPLALATTVSTAVTTTSQFIDLSATTPGVSALRILNIGTQTIWLEFVESAATAAAVATAWPMLPNTAEVFTFPNDKIGVAVIAQAVGSTVFITPGEGV